MIFIIIKLVIKKIVKFVIILGKNLIFFDVIKALIVMHLELINAKVVMELLCGLFQEIIAFVLLDIMIKQMSQYVNNVIHLGKKLFPK